VNLLLAGSDTMDVNVEFDRGRQISLVLILFILVAPGPVADPVTP
jgi:hypothetical protein